MKRIQQHICSHVLLMQETNHKRAASHKPQEEVATLNLEALAEAVEAAPVEEFHDCSRHMDRVGPESQVPAEQKGAEK